MNNLEFVKAIKDVVHESAQIGLKIKLESPSGRKPSPRVQALSAWYNSLSDTDKKMVSEVILQSVHSSVFGFFCVLDGVREIEDKIIDYDLELYFVSNGNHTRLNDPNDDLHDIYQSLVWEEVFGQIS